MQGSRHSIPGQAVWAGALCLQVCLDWSCGCVLLCLTHRCLLNTIHGKKHFLRVAFCRTIAKLCPEPDPASPAWDSLLPSAPKSWTCPSARSLLLLRPSGTETAFPVFDWKCLIITRAVTAMLSQLCVWISPFHPSHPHL